MNNMKLLSFAVGITLSASSFASFDLILAQQATSDANNFLYRVHRLDPVHGINLGSFGIGGIKAEGMAANASTGEMYTIDINGNIRVYDYSTGDRKAQWQSGLGGVTDMALSADHTKLYVVAGTTVLYSVNIASRTTSVAGSRSGQAYQRIMSTSAGNIVAISPSTSSVDRFVSSGATFTYNSSVTTAPGLTGIGQMAMTAATPTNAPNFMYAGTNLVGFHFMSGVDSFNGNGFGFSLFGFQNYTAAVPSHNGVYMIGSDSNTGGNVRISELDAQTYTANSFSFSGITGGVSRATIVLAPEPGTMVGLLVGAVLLRRRKRA